MGPLRLSSGAAIASPSAEHFTPVMQRGFVNSPRVAITLGEVGLLLPLSYERLQLQPNQENTGRVPCDG